MAVKRGNIIKMVETGYPNVILVRVKDQIVFKVFEGTTVKEFQLPVYTIKYLRKALLMATRSL